MNLYMWRSAAFANYYDGHIVVMAKNVDDARKIARERYERNVKKPYENSTWSWLVDDDGNFVDDERKDEFIEKMALFDNDIKEPPHLIEDGIVFIQGSE